MLTDYYYYCYYYSNLYSAESPCESEALRAGNSLYVSCSGVGVVHSESYSAKHQFRLYKQRLKLLKAFADLVNIRDSSKFEVHSCRTPERRRRWTQVVGKTEER